MDLTLLSGVVRNRKMTSGISRGQYLFNEGNSTTTAPQQSTFVERLYNALKRNAFCRKFALRVHRFTFQWDLVIHLWICILSLSPFFFYGDHWYALLPISVWVFYHILFLIGPRQANWVIPGFGKLKNTFKTTVEDFFSPKLLPVLSISFLLVILSLAVTGNRLGGPPLCYHSCQICLSQWSSSIPLIPNPQYVSLGVDLKKSAQDVKESSVESSLHKPVSRWLTLTTSNQFPLSSISDSSLFANMIPSQDAELFDPDHHYGCGFANGKELLGFYTMAQTSFLLFLSVVVAMAVCLAWRVAEDERVDYTAAEEMLKRQSPGAYELRSELLQACGNPASALRPEGSFIWVCFGIVAALSFTLLGWHNWSVLPPSNTSTLLIILNLLTILMTTLILHLGFFGRILALYMRNFRRVAYLTELLSRIEREEVELDHWWNCRTFVLNDDLSLDYDMGGLAVSATFVINVIVFFILIAQFWKEGGRQIIAAMLEPPGSYCAYACMYITCCLIKIFTVATNTYEEQHRHIQVLQSLSSSAALRLLLHLPVQCKTNMSMDQTSPSNTNHHQGFFIDDDSAIHSDSSPRLSTPGLKRSNSRFTLTHHMNGIGNSSGNTNNISQSEMFRVSFDCHQEDANVVLSPSRSNQRKTVQYFGNVNSGNTSGAGLFETLKNRSQFLLSNNRPGNSNNGEVNANNSNIAVAMRSFDLQSNSYDASTLCNDTGGARNYDERNDGNAPTTDEIKTEANLTPCVGDLEQQVKLFPDQADSSFLAQEEDNIINRFDVNNVDSSTTTKNIAPINIDNSHNYMGLNLALPSSISKPPMMRSMSSSVESYRQSIAEFISQIRKYDPYPCILGIPVMPALFTTSKFYIFVSFVLIGSRTMLTCWRNL